MKFQRIIEQVYCRPWLITERGWESIHRLVSERILSPKGERPTEDIWGDEMPVMKIQNGTAIIPVEGVISRKVSMIEKQCGATDVLDISDDIAKAMADYSVRNIVFDVNSPGGGVSGVPELAEQIAQANKTKKVVAYANDQMCSAAYWICAGCRAIYASPSSDVGSIGVFIPWIDRSAAYEAAGLNVEIIKAGKFKGMGYPGTSLTDDQRKLLQADVDGTYSEFISFVKQYRSGVSDETMQGQTFSGKAASENGLVSGLVSGMRELLQKLG